MRVEQFVCCTGALESGGKTITDDTPENRDLGTFFSCQVLSLSTSNPNEEHTPLELPIKAMVRQ